METIKIPLDNILEYVQNFNKDVRINDSYIKSYCALLNYFTDKNELTKEHIIVGAHAVYGWMPKILRIDIKESDIDSLNQAKKGIELSFKQLEKLKNSIGNSTIGISKLLHFINPSQYPIYDTHLYKYLHEHTKNKGHYYQVNKIEVYQNYTQEMRTAAKTEQGLVIKNLVKSKLKYDITPIRAIELAMFYMQKDKPKAV